LCGPEPGLAENLRSFCRQEYPEFQIVFGAREAGDPALDVARLVQAEFPACEISVVADDRVIGPNLKVSNVANLLPHARHHVLVLSDSDIRVAPDYLRRLAPYVTDPGVGVVSCPFRALPAQGFWSRLGAMAINEWLTPAALVSWALGLRVYSSGATLAFRRDVLERVGGFQALAGELADDYRLAERARALGFRTELAPTMVATVAAEPSLGALFRHELRWLRTIRAVQPAGHAAMLLSFAIPYALLPLLIGGRSALSVGLALAAILLRLAIHFASPRSLRERGAGALLLIPLRDPLLLLTWVVSFLGRQVVWRGVRLTVAPAGKVVDASPSGSPSSQD
jgi:ceramide glucosyltransferase